MSKVRHLSVKDAKRLIGISIENWRARKSRPRPVYFLLGETGNGKTELIKQVAVEKNMAVVELNLGNALDPTELVGCRMPVDKGEGDNKTYTLKLALLDEIARHVDAGDDFVLFIDELGAEQDHMRNFLLKLFAERSLNGVSVENAYIICAGNPPGSNYKTTELDQALRARVSTMHVEATSSEVAEYFDDRATALESDADKQDEATGVTEDTKEEDAPGYDDRRLANSYRIVANFLRAHLERFGKSDGNAPDSENPARCARAYEFAVSEIFNLGLKNQEPEFLRRVLRGILGPDTGKELADFVKKGGSGMYTPMDILNGRFQKPGNSKTEKAKWKTVLQNTMKEIERSIPNPDTTSLKNLVQWVSYGDQDSINGFMRELEQGLYELPLKTAGRLEAMLEANGYGEDIIREEERGVAVDDAAKTS